jgi:hypothetical protein
MRIAVTLLVAQALGVWILLLLGSGQVTLVLRNLIIMLDRLLVLVAGHRSCNIILVASIVSAMLAG